MQANNFKVISSNWHYVLPPSRPTISEINRIQGYLMNLEKNMPIAILGSTIEYRDLLFSLGFEDITIFEKNIDFYEWTKGWLPYNPRERVIQGDWRETLISHQDSYMVILSDLTMGNIDYDDRLPFYKSIGKSLMSGGVFIDKVLTQHTSFISLMQIKNTYEKLPINLQTLNRFNCETFFCSELLSEGIIDTTQFYKTIEYNFRESPKLLKYLEKCRLITPENCIWFYGKPWEKINQNYFSCFLKSIAYEDDFESPYYGRVKHYFNFR